MPLFRTSFIHKTIIFLVAAMFSLSTIAADFSQIQWLANQGNATAQYDLGAMYSDGQGVRQDYAKAHDWYLKAASQGNATAQFNLGMMYVKGEGVRQSKATAKKWFGKACDNGFQRGCDNYRKLNKQGY